MHQVMPLPVQPYSPQGPTQSPASQPTGGPAFGKTSIVRPYSSPSARFSGESDTVTTDSTNAAPKTDAAQSTAPASDVDATAPTTPATASNPTDDLVKSVRITLTNLLNQVLSLIAEPIEKLLSGTDFGRQLLVRALSKVSAEDLEAAKAAVAKADAEKDNSQDATETSQANTPTATDTDAPAD